MGLGEEQEPRPKAGKWRTRFLSSKGAFLATGDVAWKPEDRRLGAPCGGLSLAQEGDPELQAVEAFWQEDDVIRCVSEKHQSASTGSRKKETESECVGKIHRQDVATSWTYGVRKEEEKWLLPVLLGELRG